jgi:hypothetical protein
MLCQEVLPDSFMGIFLQVGFMDVPPASSPAVLPQAPAGGGSGSRGQGIPATTAYSGTSRVTTDLPATTAPVPMLTPSMIMASRPIHTSWPIRTPPACPGPAAIRGRRPDLETGKVLTPDIGWPLLSPGLADDHVVADGAETADFPHIEQFRAASDVRPGAHAQLNGIS